MLMPGIHSITPFLNFSLDRRKFFLQKLPHDIQITAIQPVMIDGNGVLLLLRDALPKLSWQVYQGRFFSYWNTGWRNYPSFLQYQKSLILQTSIKMSERERLVQGCPVQSSSKLYQTHKLIKVFMITRLCSTLLLGQSISSGSFLVFQIFWVITSMYWNCKTICFYFKCYFV